VLRHRTAADAAADVLALAAAARAEVCAVAHSEFPPGALGALARTAVLGTARGALWTPPALTLDALWASAPPAAASRARTA
jgi:hypothetical protein